MKTASYSEDTPFEKVAIFIGRCIYAMIWLLPLIAMFGGACFLIYMAVTELPTILK